MYRYDGMRAQIHMQLDGTVRIFARDSNELTGRFPDVINIIREAAGEDLKSFVIDTEVHLPVFQVIQETCEWKHLKRSLPPSEFLGL